MISQAGSSPSPHRAPGGTAPRRPVNVRHELESIIEKLTSWRAYENDLIDYVDNTIRFYRDSRPSMIAAATTWSLFSRGWAYVAGGRFFVPGVGQLFITWLLSRGFSTSRFRRHLPAFFADMRATVRAGFVPPIFWLELLGDNRSSAETTCPDVFLTSDGGCLPVFRAEAVDVDGRRLFAMRCPGCGDTHYGPPQEGFRLACCEFWTPLRQFGFVLLATSSTSPE